MIYLLLLSSILFLMTLSICGAATSTLTADLKRLQLINASLNIGSDPCTYFHKYACDGLGNYRNQTTAGNLELLDQRVEDDITKALDGLRPTSEFKFLREIYNYYKSCKDQENKNYTLLYVQWMINNAGAGWPLERKSASQDMNWVELLAETRKYGFNDIFLYEDVTPLREDSSKIIIELKRPPLGPLVDFRNDMSGLEYLLNEDKIAEYAKFQSKLFLLAVYLEKRPGFFGKDWSLPGNTESSPVSLKDLGIPWVNKYIQALLEQSSLDEDTIVYVQNKQYLEGLGELLRRHNNSFICEYIQIKFLMFLKETNSFSALGSCRQSVRYLLPLPMQWLYKSQHPELQTELPHIKNIFDNLKATFRKTMTNNYYKFPADIVEYLQAKLDNIELSFDRVSAQDLEQFYKSLNLNVTDYLGNRLKLSKFNFTTTHDTISAGLTRNSIAMLNNRPYNGGKKPTDQLVLFNLPYLFPRYNVIYLPLTLLQDPYYEPGLGDVYSYSTVGFLLAHHITKAFDFRYLRIDAQGRYNTTADEAIQSNRNFERIAEKLQEGLAFENLSDYGGLKLAYDSVIALDPQAWHPKVTLQGEPFKMDQIFFLSFAQNYCGNACNYSGILGDEDYSRCNRVRNPTQMLNTFNQAFDCWISKSQPLWI